MSHDIYRSRRVVATVVIGVSLLAATIINGKPNDDNRSDVDTNSSSATSSSQQSQSSPTQSLASAILAKLSVKGRAPSTGYSRDQFGGDWASEGTCNMRDKILARDMTNVKFKGDTCEVQSGILHDPYTGKTIDFVRGVKTSSAVQIDHVVAIGDAWQTGAQQLSRNQREQMYNDPLELLAVDGPSNTQKSDGDAATWLPSNKAFRCEYIARQIAVKQKYSLWITPSEHDAMAQILSNCPEESLPSAS